MPVGIIQPSNQIRLTNVSLVRLKKGGKRFEIACYKNKTLEYRSGTETDLDNVLQIPSVFLNVSKGQTASAADLAKAFGAKTPLNAIILEILNKGELQVGEKERHAQLDRVHHEVIDIVAGKLVDPASKRVYTPGMIEKALEKLSSQSAQPAREESGKASSSGSATATPPPADPKLKAAELPKWTGVVATRSAKSQALDAMKALIAHQPIPVARARMRLRVTCPTGILKQAAKSAGHADKSAEGAAGGDGEGGQAKGTVKDAILGFVEQVEAQEVVGGEWEVTLGTETDMDSYRKCAQGHGICENSAAQ
ncbi:upf0023 family protein [Lasallia pustulata]|uniref:Upf0023 family protein n=1 Tax=Lasallia pustulata TaxID=136370 RepID=A0A1W5DEF4_9LECA|nr:upf0023 family protein [Lasallia pustulata]